MPQNFMFRFISFITQMVWPRRYLEGTNVAADEAQMNQLKTQTFNVCKK
jgi:hypothetical protein